MSDRGLTVEFRLPGRKPGKEPVPAATPEAVPRIARLLALAWKWELAVRRGEVTCAEIARRHGLTRARVTQICGLTLLAPDIQEAALCDHFERRPGRDLRGIAAFPSWERQRHLWHQSQDRSPRRLSSGAVGNDAAALSPAP